MKKLMIAAAAAVAVGGAFADPLVYDYKASIKQVNIKEKAVRYANVTWQACIKYQSTASLKGYLIVDADGATSPAIQALAGSGNSVPATRPQDYGRNTAFLVVQNSKAQKDVRFPKILPAVFDAKWVNDKISDQATSGLAEGFLYVGGDIIAGQQREALDLYNGVLSANGRTPAKGFIGDYCWTSLWLFGDYNMPDVDPTAAGFWVNAQTAIDGAMGTAELTQGFAAGDFFFHDTWMNGAGIGKWSKGKNKKVCCGLPRIANQTLDTLSGNLKGGVFLCTENGTAFDSTLGPGYGLIGGKEWEDQFFTARWDNAGANPGAWLAAGDIDQTDLWQDGDLELNTGDVLTGTWSIKFNTKLVPVSVTATELTALTAAGPTEDAKGLAVLMNTIKGAAKALNRDVLFTNGQEIWDLQSDIAGHNGAGIPLLTPNFCKYYGLLNYK